MNWTGHVVAAPRSDLAGLLKRPEAFRTGIYLLLGDDPDSLGGSLAYIGEGDDVGKRLYQHARAEDQGGKDFWDRAILLTSKDANLTKAHARYLESRFITLAAQARRSRLINGTAPALLPLPEADVSDMEYFISQAKIVLPVLGVNILRSAATADNGGAGAVSGPPAASPVFVLQVKKDGITARAREIDGEFTVLEGSCARGPGLGPSTRTRRCITNSLATAASFRSPAARPCDSPVTRCLRARARLRPSLPGGRRTGVSNGKPKALASASAAGRSEASTRLPQKHRHDVLSAARIARIRDPETSHRWHDRTFPRGLMNAIAQSVSAPTACEILHKVPFRGTSWGLSGPDTFGSASCSQKRSTGQQASDLEHGMRIGAM